MLAKAKERLALAADDAVSVLIRLMQDPTVSPADRRLAATAVLDRAGISTRAELEITLSPWNEMLAGVVADVPEDLELVRAHKYPSPPPDDQDVVEGEVVPDRA